MSTLRAVLITPDYPPASGGIARLLGDLVHGTQDAAEWRVITGVNQPGFVASELRRGMEEPESVLSAVRWLRGGTERLVVCGHAYFVGAALAMARLAGAPVGTLAYGRELLPQRTAHRGALSVLRYSDRVVAISRRTETAVARLGVREERIRVVPPLFRPRWAGCFPPRSRDPQTGLHVVAVTRLSEGYKNLELLLRINQVLPPSVLARTTIIGGGPRLEALRQRSVALGVADRVEFTGHVDDAALATLMGSGHVGVFPSRDSIAERGFEGFGLVVTELAAAGMPVLIGRAAGALDSFNPAWSMLLDPDDVRSWVVALEALASDEQQRLAMAEAAFTWAAGLDSRETAHRFLASLRPA